MIKVLLLLIVVPLIEIYLLIEASQFIGTLAVVALIVVTALFGAYLLHTTADYALGCVLPSLKQGKSLAAEFVFRSLLFIAGLLLLVPGGVTDLAGFLCLLPGTRKRMTKRLIAHWSSSRAPDNQGEGVVLEGEYEEEDPAPKT